ncbi:MAG: sulfite exporter TauE/SafE family protein [Clostridia bacterium]|nr:sulfite exporter TauE/SafE family protein [Clostridia bacterium]
MDILIKIIVCFIAGVGAGLGTGFAGMSAAAAISPLLITFLGMDAYEAVGIALASDVLASAFSAYTYWKNKHLDVRNGIIMMITVLVFTAIGSWVASFVPSTTMTDLSFLMTMMLGIKFIVWPVTRTYDHMQTLSKTQQVLRSVISGTVIGSICGFVGAGGGMMMLLVLTMVLGYELKTAVGTSVFIMSFTALTGSVSHFVIDGAPDWLCLAVCIASTLLWAQIAAKIANKADTKTLNRVTGVVLLAIGLSVLGVNIFKNFFI